MLRIEGLSAGYSAKPVLNDVSIDVGAGEFVAIVGPNGAGKTTLFKTISGIVKPGGGKITFDGVDLLRCRRRSARISASPTSPRAVRSSRH
jgi:branched-chain amino acid transport system ATP-binding protein